jgi:hypothetical protein
MQNPENETNLEASAADNKSAVSAEPVASERSAAKTADVIGENSGQVKSEGSAQVAPSSEAVFENLFGSPAPSEPGVSVGGAQSIPASPIIVDDICATCNGTRKVKTGGKGRPRNCPDCNSDGGKSGEIESRSENVKSVINTPAPVKDFGKAAEGIFALSTGALTMVFGPEWQPESPEEKQQVCACLAEYLKTKDIPDLPPGIALCFVALVYSAKRFRAPTTSEKIKAGWVWLKLKLGFGKK